MRRDGYKLPSAEVGQVFPTSWSQEAMVRRHCDGMSVNGGDTEHRPMPRLDEGHAGLHHKG